MKAEVVSQSRRNPSKQKESVKVAASVHVMDEYCSVVWMVEVGDVGRSHCDVVGCGRSEWI